MTMKFPIIAEQISDDEFAFIAEVGDVQIGWCRRNDNLWNVRDMDEHVLAGPFNDVAQAISAGKDVLSYDRDASNPGW